MHALTSRRCLIAGGSSSLALAAQRSLFPPLATMVITITLTVWGLPAFSGAGLMPRLPFLRSGLVTISGIYLLRGLVLVGDVARWFAAEHFPSRQMVFSAAALAIGLCHTIGTVAVFRREDVA